MLCRVALHHELAELRAEVGPQVFDDPVAFRAAFDDFIPEGSASTGEVSLLVGAIATGALARVKEQLALGADPEMTIAVQGDLLARDRGTTESSGARWALSALAHAVGAIPVDRVLTRPTPGPDSVDTAGRPPAPSRPSPVDPGPTQQIGDATRVVSHEPPDPPPTAPVAPVAPVAPEKGGINPLLIATVVVLAIVAVTAIVLLLLRDDDSPDNTAEDGSSDTDSGPSGDEEILAEEEITDGEVPMLVRLVHDGADAELVLLIERDGEFAEVDREPTSCPYLESSYDAGVNHTGGFELFWGWSNLEQDGFGEYGRVVPEIESLELYGGEEGYVCPTD
jgi:hypothetical protein